jgi:hypothetical protein
MAQEIFPADFMKLPEAKRQEIVTGMKATVQLAYDRVVPIVISAPPRSTVPSELRSASGFFVEISEQMYLGTAHHVWQHFQRRHRAGEGVVFQAGELTIKPDVAGIQDDAARDIIFVPVDAVEARRSGQTISSASLGWPPPPPAVGSFVVFSGCPETHRERDSRHHVEFGCFSSVMRVTDVSGHELVCEFERDTWIWDGPNGPPAPGADLSGMSGGPVFALGELAIPLVGLVRRFVDKWELLHVATFDGFAIPRAL